MAKMHFGESQEASTDIQEPEPVAWTADQVVQWRQENPQISVWSVVFLQAALGLVLAMLTLWVTESSPYALSVLYGAAAVVVPGAIFARGVTSRFAGSHPSSAAMSFLVWEGVKLVLTVLSLWMAPRWIQDLSWPAMLLGLVITMKVYWLALASKSTLLGSINRKKI